jgi:tetratricopeptide (TPR) repeat protein
MRPELWKQIEDVFEQVVDLPTAERQQKLAEVEDAELRAHVTSLLEHATDHSLRDAINAEARMLTDAERGTLIGKRLGVYRVVKAIGEGGMGTVYLAERADDEYRSHVAIKVLQHGNSHAIARFREERQILATLEHPGIVRLLDGGSTEDGVPYLVMDYIDGVPLTRYVREQQLSVDRRLELFRQVCAAIQYAHEKLIVHRDLKPSNILVDSAGQAHLLDFGIAKLLAPGAREAPTYTGLLTPEYASPEQVRGDHVAAATDVYSLGAVLYELLADTRPMPATSDALEMLRQICEDEPPRPSTVAPRDRRTAIAGDLDNIVMKALAKPTAQRYASVEQLSADVERHLAGLPVVARPATFGYRSGKFIRRNRGKLALAAVAATALSAATVFSLFQARRADAEAQRAGHRFDDVRGLAHSLLFELDEKIRDLPGSTTARELVVTRAREYLDRLTADVRDDADLERELARAYMKVGDIEGSEFAPNLGRPRDSLVSYAKAGAILDRLPDDEQTRSARVQWMIGRGFVLHALGDVAAARATLLEGIAANRKLAHSDHELTMHAYNGAGEISVNMGDLTTAQQIASDARAEAEGWRAAAPSDLDASYWAATTLELHSTIEDLLGDPEAAVADSQNAAALLRSIAAKDPESARYRRELGYDHYLLGGYLGGIGYSWWWTPSKGDLAGGEHAFQIAVDVLEKGRAQDAADTRGGDEIAAAYGLLASTIAATDRTRAQPVFERALAAWQAIPEAIRGQAYSIQLEWFTHCAFGEQLAATTHDRTTALAQIDEAMAILARAEPSPEIDDDRLQCKLIAARTHHELGDDAAAGSLDDEVIAALQPRIAARHFAANTCTGLSAALELRATLRPARACEAHRQARAMWASWPWPATRMVASQIAELDRAIATCPP